MYRFNPVRGVNPAEVVAALEGAADALEKYGWGRCSLARTKREFAPRNNVRSANELHKFNFCAVGAIQVGLGSLVIWPKKIPMTLNPDLWSEGEQCANVHTQDIELVAIAIIELTELPGINGPDRMPKLTHWNDFIAKDADAVIDLFRRTSKKVANGEHDQFFMEE